MPSKVLIEAANTFARRKDFKQMGIDGASSLSLDNGKLMEHVRSLRDRFVRGVVTDMEDWQDSHLLKGEAKFLDQNTLDVNGKKITAESVIIATGSRPIIPEAWQGLGNRLITSDTFFELETLPKTMAVIGLGVIGIELGQALARVGVDVVGIGRGSSIGGLTNPQVSTYAQQKLSKDFPISLDGVNKVSQEGDHLIVETPSESYKVDKALATLGRRLNIDKIGLENIGIELDGRGLPRFDSNTHRIHGTNLFIAGDVSGERTILHEAADEGRIAGYNAVRNSDECFKKRVSLGITFSDPNIAVVGKSFADLEKEKAPYVTGTVSFEGQGRSIVKLKEVGSLHVYVHEQSGEILGSEIFAPDGEHLAHMLAWAIEAKINVFEALSLPFYHPVIQEGLRTALRNAAAKTKMQRPDLEVLRCQDAPVGVFAGNSR